MPATDDDDANDVPLLTLMPRAAPVASRCALCCDGARWARQADPSATLCINEYHLVTNGVNNLARDMEILVNDMIQDGVPIDCIGVQSYMAPGERVARD
jgi:hypothetical protein